MWLPPAGAQAHDNPANLLLSLEYSQTREPACYGARGLAGVSFGDSPVAVLAGILDESPMTLSTSAIRHLLLSLVALLVGPIADAGELNLQRVTAVKAAYLRYIAEYTSWPAQQTAGSQTATQSGDDQRPIVIGLLGSDPNGVATLIRRRAESAEGLSAQGRPLMVVDIAPPDTDGAAALLRQLEQCNVLFVSEDAAHRWRQIHALLGNRAIVTVGETAGFAEQRGMIEFVIDADAGRVRMHINLDAVNRADLTLSARLLGLKDGVKIVHDAGDIG
jgi:YfiR/HmsC-like